MDPTHALLDAIARGDVDGATALLDREPGAAGGVGPAGESPVLAAVYRGQLALALRIAAGRALDITEAAALGDSDAVAAALARDPAAVGARSQDGWTPLHLAAFFGHAPVAAVLVAAGADLAAVSANGMANQPLHAALAGAGAPDVVQLLVARGADVNATSHGGWTPLHLAASRGAVGFLHLLLAHGADQAAAADGGKSAADIATERGHPDAASVLRGPGR